MRQNERWSKQMEILCEVASREAQTESHVQQDLAKRLLMVSVKRARSKGELTAKGKLTTIGFEYWDPKNCAEVDAIQKATSAGIDLEHAHMYTVGAKYGKESFEGFEKKEACLNCTAAFGSSVRDRNYSGWSSKVPNDSKEFGKFEELLEEWYSNTIQKDKYKHMSQDERISAKLNDKDKAVEACKYLSKKQ